MHPAFTVSDSHVPKVAESFVSHIDDGKLILDSEAGNQSISIYMGGVNPYATYEIDVDSYNLGVVPTEIGIELARMGLRDKVQVVSKLSAQGNEIFFRLYEGNKLKREIKYGNTLPEGAFVLRVQLYGRTLGIFITRNNETRYIGHIPVKEHFGDVLDFRHVKTAERCTFNLISNLQGTVVLNGARSFLSSGIGQADIRLISNEDLSPYLENGRLWFTFSCRGIDTPQSVQGVLSLDPSVFDLRFEGMIVFDHGDGLLRNDYASHLFLTGIRKSGEHMFVILEEVPIKRVERSLD